MQYVSEAMDLLQIFTEDTDTLISENCLCSDIVVNNEVMPLLNHP